MILSLKKKYAVQIGLLMLVAIISPIHAAYNNEYSSDASVVCFPDTDLCCEPACPPCGEWLLTGDLLYWRALQNGLECGCGPEIKDNWDLGYRVGLEYDSGCSGWNMGAYWTHFQNDYKHNSPRDNFAHWNLKYDTIDVLLNYEIFNDSCFSYAPFIGLRGAKVDERVRARFEDCNCNGTDPSSVTDENHKQKFCGLGPEIGIGADYNLGCGFSLFGSAGVGMLYGNFKINVRDFETIVDPTDDGACCINKSIHACQAFVDAAIGLKWEHCFCNNMALITRVGLEHHRYFNQNRIGDYGDLIFDGAFLSVGLKY